MTAASRPQPPFERHKAIIRLNLDTDRIEEAARVADRHGEHGLADQLWAFAELLRVQRVRLERGH